MADNSPVLSSLRGVPDDGEAIAVVQRDVAASSALGVDTNRYITLTADLAHPVDELPALRGPKLRSVVSELSSGIPGSSP